MNSLKKISGFTLIELIVVISIIALLLLFSFPMFEGVRIVSHTDSQVGDVERLINDLKTRAIERNIDFTLHLDSGSGMVWVTDDAMDEDARRAAKENSARLSEKITISDVEFPEVRETGSREHQIRFSRLGYSDFALIHVIADHGNITIKIEPFLSRVLVQKGHVNFEDCF